MGLTIDVGDFVSYHGIKGFTYYSFVLAVNEKTIAGSWSTNIEKARNKTGIRETLEKTKIKLVEKLSGPVEDLLWD